MAEWKKLQRKSKHHCKLYFQEIYPCSFSTHLYYTKKASKKAPHCYHHLHSLCFSFWTGSFNPLMRSIYNALWTESFKNFYCKIQKIKCSKLKVSIYYSIQKELIRKKQIKIKLGKLSRTSIFNHLDKHGWLIFYLFPCLFTSLTISITWT